MGCAEASVAHQGAAFSVTLLLLLYAPDHIIRMFLIRSWVPAELLAAQMVAQALGPILLAWLLNREAKRELAEEARVWWV